jgi:hypothetical protein
MLIGTHRPLTIPEPRDAKTTEFQAQISLALSATET